jgi:hypothetical protein
VDPHCFDADPEPDQAQNLDADPDPDTDPGGVGGSRSAKNVHPPWQNPRYAPGLAYGFFFFMNSTSGLLDCLSESAIFSSPFSVHFTFSSNLNFLLKLLDFFSLYGIHPAL